MTKYLSVLVVLAVALAPAPTWSQEKPKYLLKKKQTDKKKDDKCKCDDKKPKKEKAPSEWQFKLRVGSVFQLNSNKSVIGKRDGTSRSIGADLHFEANWTRRKHEIRNRADANVVFIKTPNTGGWVSAIDVLELESIYQYRSLPWMGPFGRVGVATSMFVGRDLRTNSVQYQYPDGTLTEERTELRLTDPFSPVTLLQTAGVFINPIRDPRFDLDIRAGIGAREVLADGQLGVLDDKDTTGIVEVVDLRDYAQAGVELIVMTRGQLFDKKVQYFSGGEFLLPVVRSELAGDDRSAFKLIEKRFRLGIAYKIAKWATLLYEIRLVHQPQLVDTYQVQNAFGFKGSYSVL